MGGNRLRPFLMVSLAVHVVLFFCYVHAVRARVPVPRPPVYHVSLVELPPAPKPKQEEIKIPAPAPKEEEKPAKIPEKPRPKKKTPEKKVEKKPEPKKEETKIEPAPEKPGDTENRVTTASGALTVEAEDFPFAYYLALIESRIGGRWSPPRGIVTGGKKPAATVRFEILRSGAVRSAHVSLTSGIPFFDTSALRAVLDSDPFPPLPEAFPGERLGVNFVFTYEG